MKTLLALLFAFATAVTAADRPNIVWIVSEDNSKHYLELFDKNGAETPYIEALASEGVTFTRAFSNSPVCSVARTTLATGCYAPRIGAQFHRRSEFAQLPGDLRLFHTYLREAGYYTSNDSKEDYNVTPTKNSWDDSSRGATWRNRTDPAQPFFHMESHAVTHESSLHFDQNAYETESTKQDPAAIQLPPNFPDTPLFRYTYARYLDNIQKVDGIVGETVAKLKEDGVYDDTIIFYFGDHGGVLPHSKGYLQETGLHVPLVVRLPEKFAHLVAPELGSRVDSFVSFVDFAPTVLALAGLEAPREMDGQTFLVKGSQAQDSALGYADRFDEKYELLRSIRVGDYKYIRSYQPFYPDGMQNNYRYKMLAYREWRELSEAGELDEKQAAFFEPKPAERLYDLSTDPYETVNLSESPDEAIRLVEMRRALNEKLASMPDLGFFPEPVLYRDALANPVAFGQLHQDRIVDLMTVADIVLLPWQAAETPLRDSLGSDDPMVRYWAATGCVTFGKEAASLIDEVKPLLEDESFSVRVRATEFLSLSGNIDPIAAVEKLVASAANPVEQLFALNSAVFLQDHTDGQIEFDVTAFDTVNEEDEAFRRIAYLRGDWLTFKPGKKKKSKTKK